MNPAQSVTASLDTASPPLLFRLGCALNDRGLRGGERLIDIADHLGQLDRVISYELCGDVRLDVPLYRPDNRWSQNEVRYYEAELIDAFAHAIGSEVRDVHFIDCGADIGTISTLLFSRVPALAGITAFEPNSTAFEVLQRNLDRLPVNTDVHHKAVSDFAGMGRMVQPPYDDSPHASYLSEAKDGDIEVTTIDALNLPLEMVPVIKIDTEGTERDVIRGARKTIAHAPRFVVAIEAHLSVIERTGIDPHQIVSDLNEIRPVVVNIVELPEINLDLSRPFIEQVPHYSGGHNLICMSPYD